MQYRVIVFFEFGIGLLHLVEADSSVAIVAIVSLSAPSTTPTTPSTATAATLDLSILMGRAEDHLTALTLLPPRPIVVMPGC